MIAEIHGKISSTGSNLTDTLEDKLTGDVFGVIRYVPYNLILKSILNKIPFKQNILLGDMFAANLDSEYIDKNISFWPKQKNAELDLLIQNNEILIGIEVKYKSLLSNSMELSDIDGNQLIREAKALNELSQNRKKFLILISPLEIGSSIIKDLNKSKPNVFGKLNKLNIIFGYIFWEDIYEIIKQIQPTLKFNWQKIIIGDLIKLFQKKGFERFSQFFIPNKKVDNSCYYFNTKEKKILSFKTKPVSKELFYVFK